jgi:hypothetical protein
MVHYLSNNFSPPSGLDTLGQQYVLIAISVTQKWGLLATGMACLMLWVIGFLFKVRKNVKLKQTFNFWSFGLALLFVLISIMPYIILHFLEQTKTQ